MIKIRKRSRQKGFTLIELLVVLSIIGLLASIALVSYKNARTKSRDAVRRQQLVQLQKAVELYAENNNGVYPNTGGAWVASEPGEPVGGGVSTDITNYIPGLAPTYVGKLPRDPSGSLSLQTFCSGSGWQKAFIYGSNAAGTQYKIMSHCATEGPVAANDPMADPQRDGGPQGSGSSGCDGSGDGTNIYSLAVYSSGYRCQ
jgi:prepilin-type N-terminal cleavage/methylation domain-containing protein